MFRMRHTGSNKGFSLVEAILAMTILGIATAGILTSFSAAMIAGKLAEDYAVADSLTGMLKAQVRANMFNPLLPNSGTFASYPNFSWQVNYTVSSIESLYQVEMIVAWRRGSRQHVVRQYTFHYQQVDLTAV